LYPVFFGRMLNEWNEELERLKPPGFPDLYFHTPPRGPFSPRLPDKDKRDLVGLSVTDYVLKDPAKERLLWAPMRAGLPLPRKLAALDIWCAGVGYKVTERYAPN
jgi:hypothetical protein